MAMPVNQSDAAARRLDRLKRSYAAAMKRKDPYDRPRSGWQLVELTGKQVWRLTTSGRDELVVGQPQRGLWAYIVHANGKTYEGSAGFLGVAMEAAEQVGTLAWMDTQGYA